MKMMILLLKNNHSDTPGHAQVSFPTDILWSLLVERWEVQTCYLVNYYTFVRGRWPSSRKGTRDSDRRPRHVSPRRCFKLTDELGFEIFIETLFY